MKTLSRSSSLNTRSDQQRRRHIIKGATLTALIAIIIAPGVTYAVGVSPLTQTLLDYISILTFLTLLGHRIVMDTVIIPRLTGSSYGRPLEFWTAMVGTIVIVVVVATHLNFFIHLANLMI